MKPFLHPYPIFSTLLNLNFSTWKTPKFKVPKILPGIPKLNQKSPKDLKLILILSMKQMHTEWVELNCGKCLHNWWRTEFCGPPSYTRTYAHACHPSWPTIGHGWAHSSFATKELLRLCASFTAIERTNRKTTQLSTWYLPSCSKKRRQARRRLGRGCGVSSPGCWLHSGMFVGVFSVVSSRALQRTAFTTRATSSNIKSKSRTVLSLAMAVIALWQIFHVYRYFTFCKVNYLTYQGAATQARLFLTRINFDARQKHLPLFSIRVATQEAFMKRLFFRASQQTFLTFLWPQLQCSVCEKRTRAAYSFVLNTHWTLIRAIIVTHNEARCGCFCACCFWPSTLFSLKFTVFRGFDTSVILTSPDRGSSTQGAGNFVFRWGRALGNKISTIRLVVKGRGFCAYFLNCWNRFEILCCSGAFASGSQFSKNE